MAKKSPFDEALELQHMLVDYAKQETVDPLKSLGRYLGLGLAGAVLLFMGVSFIGLGVLRFVQSLEWFAPDETSEIVEQASWSSTIPYLAAVATLIVALAILFMALVKAKRKVTT